MTMTPKEFMKAVYEIAYGEDAYFRGFFPEEVVERLQEFSDGSNPILIEDAWNEAEELNTSLRELSDADLVDCRQALIDRTNRIMEALNEIGTEQRKLSHSQMTSSTHSLSLLTRKLNLLLKNLLTIRTQRY